MLVPLRAGSNLGAYRLLEDFRVTANGRMSFAERAGKHFFVKEYPNPKRPGPNLPPALIPERERECTEFENRKTRVLTALKNYCALGGTVHFPIDFFSFGL